MQNSILFMLLILAGCATTEPTVEAHAQRVEVPIVVPCRAAIPPAPDFKFDKIDPKIDIFEKTKILLADRKLHLGYEAELLAALNSCVK